MPEFERLLSAVHLATRKLASLGDMEVVLRDVLSICVEAVGATGGTIYLHDPAAQTLKFKHVIPADVASKLQMRDIPDDFGVAGRVFHSGRAETSEFPAGGDPARRDIVDITGIPVTTMITVPLQVADMPPIGVLQLVNKRDAPFDKTDAAVLDTLSEVSTLALMNSELLTRSTRVASLEGMGRTAHDLANKAGVLVTFLPDMRRNLDGLRAGLDESGVKGKARVHLEMLDSLYTDVFAPYSDRVYRYARLINDLAAGKKVAPKKKVQSFESVVTQSVAYLESRARQNHVEIVYDMQDDAPDFAFDELFVMRISENLVSNAIKAVRETIPESWLAQHAGEDDACFGKVTVRCRFDADHHVLEVQDNGPGMSQETIERIRSGEVRSGWERTPGTGLGTKVVLDLATSHDAKVSIDSELGKGSVVRIEFPHQEAEQAEQASA